MSNVAFRVNPDAIVCAELDQKIKREYMMKRYPETVEYYKKLGQSDTAWDRKLEGFIKQNPNIFRNDKLISRSSNIFRELTSYAIMSGKDDFSERVGTIVSYQEDATEEEIENIKNAFPNFTELKNTQEFEGILSKTRRYKSEMEKGWNSFRKSIEETITSVLGLNILSDKRGVVTLVMPPISKNQRNLPGKYGEEIFILSHPEKLKGRSNILESISIAHAQVHSVLPYKPTMTLDKKDKHHAFIKFLTDKELYSRMTGKSYLENDSENEKGKIMGLIYPYWLGYLHRKDSNPAEVIAIDIKRDKIIFDSLKSNSSKRKLYGSYNFEKLSPEKIAQFFKSLKGITPYEFNDIDFEDIRNVYKDEYLQLNRNSLTTENKFDNR